MENWNMLYLLIDTQDPQKTITAREVNRLISIAIPKVNIDQSKFTPAEINSFLTLINSKKISDQTKIALGNDLLANTPYKIATT